MSKQINLKIMNDLVRELNKMVATIEKHNASLSEDVDTDFIIDLSKAAGIATAVSFEATALVSDFMKLVNQNSVPTPQVASGLTGLDELFSGLGLKTKKN